MKNIFIQNVICFFLGISLVISGCAQPVADNTGSPGNTASNQPALLGRLIFHAYSCYSCNDSKLYQFDFATATLTIISNNWAITAPMNAHPSPDGKTLVFMGISSATGWDIFRWRIGSTEAPLNLTASYGSSRDEDPKYAFSGNRIVFKQNGVMKEMDTTGRLTRVFSVSQTEASMPFYAKGDSVLLYSGMESSGTTADIGSLRLNNSQEVLLSANSGLEEYYPVTRDDTSFYFTRWYSPANHNDQIYLGYLDGRPAQRLAFNEMDQNYSDACPVSQRYLVVSSTTAGGRGGYDLYVVDMISGKRWSMDLYRPGINTAGNELGAMYISF